MKNPSTLPLLAIFSSLALASSAHAAETLTGSNLVAAGGVITWYGDKELDRVTGPGLGFSVGYNHNLQTGVDLKIHADRYEASGENNGLRIEADGTAVGLDLILWKQVKEGSLCHPLADIGVEYGDFSSTYTQDNLRETDDSSDVGGVFRLGSELNSGGPLWAMVAGGYGRIGGQDTWLTTGDVGLWLTPRLLGSTGVQYDFDSEDISLNLEFSLKL